jgi:demethylmenaquinone methyltransferase/2-methoxy-6-polyprenyl-1,4-benzoquinol methylase
MSNSHPDNHSSVDTKESTTTHFGFQQVDKDQKAGLVGEVFTSVASRYDIMNDLMSAGIHRLWKRFTVEVSAVRKGNRVLDLAGGTGDLAAKFSRLVGDQGEVILSDINQSMLATGRDKQTDLGNTGNISYVLGDAQYLPFQSNYFDCVTIGFGLRNVTDKDLALRSILRVLKPGGRLLVLEFSKPDNPLLSKIYDSYSFKLLPKIGKLIAQDEDSYRYLAESIRMHPDQETLKDMLEDAGFVDCEYHNMTGGIVAIHKGIKV